jgi:hypothetical protein
MYVTPHGWCLLPIHPFPLYTLFLFVHITNHPLYLLGNPLFDARGANVRPHSCPVGDKRPSPTPNPPPFLFLMVPYSSCYMFQRRHHNIRYIVWYNCILVKSKVPVRSSSPGIWRKVHFHSCRGEVLHVKGILAQLNYSKPTIQRRQVFCWSTYTSSQL